VKVAYLAAGAGGMYCGSCMHDNRLAATLIEQGRDVVLIPLYTPLRTDEVNVSQRRVFYGGINVYLQQVAGLFRRTPWFLDRLLDGRALLRGVGWLASSTCPEALGALTLSVLKAEHGAQRKELEKLIAFLRRLSPDLVYLPNLMFVGLARQLKEDLGAPVLCGLAGEDIFLDRLPEPYRGDVFELIRRRAEDVDGFVALTQYYAGHAAEHFGLPVDRVHHIPMGIHVADFVGAATPPDGPFTIGYLARICPEKGLSELCEAFVDLRRMGRECRLRIAGYMGSADRPYLNGVVAAMRQAGFDDETFECVGEVNWQEKVRFLQSLHVLSVPTSYPESKGFYVLEALAAGVPVVLPSHGSFPELIEATRGGLLYPAGNSRALVDALAKLMDDSRLRCRLAVDGRDAVHAAFTAERMATQAWQLLQQFASPRSSADNTFPDRRTC
jgi:glycosyltransferase involved in cell wall biosynthesis